MESALKTVVGEIGRILNGAHPALSEHSPFLFCLSRHGDQLSQWRAYGGGGVGYSIAFSSEQLARWEQFSLLKVTYDSEKKRETFDGLFESASVKLREALPPLVHEVKKSGDFDMYREKLGIVVAKVMGPIVVPIVEAICSFKDEAFEKEAESRLVTFEGRGGEVRFRPSSGLPVPFLAMKPPNGEGNLPITRVIVGPHRYPDLAKRGVEMVLDKKGYRVPVDLSSVPFRMF